MEGAYESTLLLPGLAHFFKKKQLKPLKEVYLEGACLTSTH